MTEQTGTRRTITPTRDLAKPLLPLTHLLRELDYPCGIDSGSSRPTSRLRTSRDQGAYDDVALDDLEWQNILGEGRRL